MANVVLNRVLSPKFPNSVDGVIFQKGQFSVVDKENPDNFYAKKTSSRALKAATDVFENSVRVLPKTVMFFKSSRLPKEWGVRKYYGTASGNMYYE
jgi:spore germination cell wall hydrolase CwlJ-like protein